MVKSLNDPLIVVLNIFILNLENCQPNQVIHSIVPKWNSFVFFQVSPYSYHQVSEILSKDKTRLSINGWFRGPVAMNATNYIEPITNLVKCLDVSADDFLYKWINPYYLEDETQISIQQEFKETSEMSLPNFLAEKMYRELAKHLTECSAWKWAKPPNKRKYQYLDKEDADELIKEFINVMTSEEVFLTMANFTGLKLHPICPEMETDDDNCSDEEATASKSNSVNKIDK